MIEIRMYCDDPAVLDAFGMFSDVDRRSDHVYATVDSADKVSWLTGLVNSLNSKNEAQLRLDVIDTSC